LEARSKTPRGRGDPLGELAYGGDIHLAASPQVLKQDRLELEDSLGALAPRDDGVHARTIAVVGTDDAVAVTAEPRGVAAGATVPLAGNQIYRGVLDVGLHGSLSMAHRVAPDNGGQPRAEEMSSAG
jgi:hypothetical protein